MLFRDLGVIDYKEAWDYQEKLFDKTVQTKFHNRKVGDDEQVVTKQRQRLTVRDQLCNVLSHDRDLHFDVR